MTQSIHHRFPKIYQFRNVVKLAQKNFDTFMPTVVPYIGRIKTHGCFPSTAKVTMYDGSTKKISKVQVGDLVLGCDEYGNLISNKVTNTFINGITDVWIKIQINNRQAGNQHIICTPNHKIFTTNRGYVAAEELNYDDILLYTKLDINLTSISKSILTGKILGDGYNRIRLNTEDAYLLFHTIKDIVPECMQYKLPENCRGQYAKPIVENSLDFYSVEASIKNIQTISSDDYPSKGSKSKLNKKYDIETETHNYFVSGCLVHNSNSSIVINKDGSFYAQSRKKIIHPDNDNYGFAKWVFANIVEIQDVVKNDIIDTFADVESVVLYGEWIGNGIQSGVAVSKIHKTFIVFSIKVIYTNGIENFCNNFIEFEPNREIGLYHIDNFPIYEIDIDFKNPQAAQDLLIQYTKEVEDHCPVGAYFGVDGIGEGLVFSPKYAYSHPTDFDYVFKSVGEKYTPSNVSTVGKVDIEGLEDMNSLVCFLLDTSPEHRVAQQIRILKELGTPMDDMKYMKCLIDAVLDDIDSENEDDIINSGLPKKVIYGKLTKRIKEYYIDTLQTW